MQKKIIALAVAGLVSGAAFAQSNVTIYGIADMSYVNYSDANADGVSSTHQINSGQWKTSRFGLKGSEDLGNDLSAIFQMEFAMNMDVNNGPITQRPSWVGLRSKSLGELSAGNFTTLEDQLLVATSTMLEYGTVASPKYVYIETVGGSEARNMISNAVHYYSPVWDGFQIKAGISTHASNSDDVSATGLTNNATTNNGNNRVVAAALHYNKGPLVAGATYEYNKYEDYSGRPSTIKLDSGNTWNLAAAYDFGVARVSGAYGRINYAENGTFATGQRMDNRTQWQLGVSAPITPKDLISLNYAHANISYNDRKPTWNDDSIGFWGIGYQHSLSKRTTLYAAYGDINQDDDANTKARLDSTTPTTTSGGFQSAFAFGIRHNF